VRVTRPGGRVVVVDPDQESLVIQVPGVRQSILGRLKALRRDVGYRNGRHISQVAHQFEQMRMVDISVDAFPLVLRDPADAFGLPSWPRQWRAEGGFTDEELSEWDTAMQHPGPGFLYVVTFLVVAGRKV
jgi:hypothetical protein